jgi:SAM-dependent methyltransferase
MTALPHADHARETHDAFAAHYDLWTAHHDYEHWTSTLERLARDHGLRGSRMLDVACGTGKSFIPFLRRGYDVTACDFSAAMLACATAKAGGKARLELHDMRALPALGAFDLVCCLDDALNYVLTDDELVSALSGMARNLAPGGVVVFDVNTVRSYRMFYGALIVVPSDDHVVVWTGGTPQSFAAGEHAVATAELFARSDGVGWERRRAVHHQRHHPREAVEAAIAAAGLACSGVYGMQLDGSVAEGYAEDANSKAIFLARREAS